MTNPTAVRVLRTVFGLLPIVAIGWQLTRHIGLGFDVLNFFSYFTNLSNLFAACVLLTVSQSGTDPRAATARLTAVVAMTIVGVVFSAFLRKADLGDLQPWVNFIVHYLMPCIVLLDWILFPPPVRLGVRALAWSLLFPLLYVIYTLLRGKQTHWYPYPFLNPSGAGGLRESSVLRRGHHCVVCINWMVTVYDRESSAIDDALIYGYCNR